MNTTLIFNQLRLFAWTVLAEARSSRVIIAAAIISLVAISLSLFVGEIAIAEKIQSQTAISAAFLRLAVLFFVSLFTINSLVREMNDRMLLLYLSMPISRSVFIFGKFLGFMILAMIFSMLAMLIVSMHAEFYPSFLWGISLMMESWIMIGFCFLCAYSFGQITLAFSAVTSIYFLSRSLSAVILISNNPLRAGQDSITQQFFHGLLSVLDYLLPRLDKFSRTEWLMYNNVSMSEISFVLQQTLIYLLLLLSASFFDFYRKNI